MWHGKLQSTAPPCAVALPAAAAAAASMTLSQPRIDWDDIWKHAAPISITIQL